MKKHADDIIANPAPAFGAARRPYKILAVRLFDDRRRPTPTTACMTRRKFRPNTGESTSNE